MEHGSQALSEMHEDLEKYSPLRNEFEFMGVEKDTGRIRLLKGTKRRRGADVSDVTEPSSSRIRCI